MNTSQKDHGAAQSASVAQTASMQRVLRPLFWVVLIGFLAWDWTASKPVDLRSEPPLIAAGSGQVTEGGHCSMK